LDRPIRRLHSDFSNAPPSTPKGCRFQAAALFLPLHRRSFSVTTLSNAALPRLNFPHFLIPDEFAFLTGISRIQPIAEFLRALLAES
jgi:hypothetical protein